VSRFVLGVPGRTLLRNKLIEGYPVVPTQAGPVTRSVTVPHAGHGVSQARHALASELSSLGVAEEPSEDAMLVMSELVSNAVKHAAPLPGGEVRVRWSIATDCLHLEITDGGAVTRPNPAIATVFALGGRGLDIVRTISDQWGVTHDSDSVTVWADVPRLPTATAGTEDDVPAH
jgi:anti-sigma regulatory factor (Ser/Thr protein kinase)